MNRTMRRAFLSLAFAVVLAPEAFGQYTKHMADSYGLGPEGTIGRGTAIVPEGPSDPRTQGAYSASGPRAESFYGPLEPSTDGSGVFYQRGYVYVARPWFARTPYRTDRFFEPGDGYRYPLYYNPSTGGYFYYPVRR